MNRYMAALGIMLLVLLHLQLIFHPLQQPFFLFALLLFLSAVWLMICRRIGMKLTLTLLLILLAAAIIMFPITLDALRARKVRNERIGGLAFDVEFCVVGILDVA